METTFCMIRVAVPFEIFIMKYDDQKWTVQIRLNAHDCNLRSADEAVDRASIMIYNGVSRLMHDAHRTHTHVPRHTWIESVTLLRRECLYDRRKLMYSRTLDGKARRAIIGHSPVDKSNEVSPHIISPFETLSESKLCSRHFWLSNKHRWRGQSWA